MIPLLAQAPPMWWLGSAPFALLLLAIAILPLLPATSHWWHSNRNKLIVSLAAASATLIYLTIAESWAAAGNVASHAVFAEFVPFMMLLFSLFVVSGGIHIDCDLVARPRTTTGILALGAAIASVVGTTGASMLLIRPLLATTSERTYRVHTIVFFIFLVSNVGGTLLPIGDPPLFVGYLRGVPFWWTLTLWKEWAVCTVALLALHWIIDTRLWAKEPRAARVFDQVRVRPLRITGSFNFLLLAIIVLAVAFIDPKRTVPGTDWAPFPYLRELILLACSALSMWLTPKTVRQANKFSFFAIMEVAAIFIGIFVAMHVPLEVLQAEGSRLGLTTPGKAFWATGILSSFLDNAPTYLVFLQAAQVAPLAPDQAFVQLAHGARVSESLLTAVSLGAVFMGANTYIGNGPNFMVRAIAEESGVRMPSFFGYMLWALAILIPLMLVIHWLFLA